MRYLLALSIAVTGAASADDWLGTVHIGGVKGTATSGFANGNTTIDTNGIATADPINAAGGLTLGAGLTGILQGNGASAMTVISNSSTAGQVLRVTGASTYGWGAIDLADADAITGALPAANVGNGLTDAQVSDTMTASIVKGSGTTTDAVDLATAEVAGVLPDANVIDSLTVSGGTVDNSAIGASTKSTGAFTHVGVGAAADADIMQLMQSGATHEGPTMGTELADGSGWTLGTGWSGDWATGFVHAAGNTATLTRSFTGLTSGTSYLVQFTINGEAVPAGYVQIDFGGMATVSTQYAYTGLTTDTTFGFAPDATGTSHTLTFTPASAFNGTISSITVKAISATSTRFISVQDSTGTAQHTIRAYPWWSQNFADGYSSGGYIVTSPTNVRTFAYSNDLRGANAGRYLTSGKWNTAAGADAMQEGRTASYNVAMGVHSLLYNKYGNFNAALGVESLYHAGQNGHLSSFNAALGYAAMSAATSVQRSVVLGANTGATGSTIDNVILVGYGVDVPAATTSDYLNIGGAIKGDLSTKNIAIGAEPTAGSKLLIKSSTGSGATLNTSLDDFALDLAASGGIAVVVPNGSAAGIAFGSASNAVAGRMMYNTNGTAANGTWDVFAGNAQVMKITKDGATIGGSGSPVSGLDVDDDDIRIMTAKTPASASATGAVGTICWDSSYIYICVATDTWKRVAIATW